MNELLKAATGCGMDDFFCLRGLDALTLINDGNKKQKLNRGSKEY